MIGAICGDIVGSIYEFNNIKTTEFNFFAGSSKYTDDTVMTVATMDGLLNNVGFAQCYKRWYRKYPYESYGTNFIIWCESKSMNPYYSFGNGSAMRVSPVGYWYDSLEATLEGAKKTAEVTHNHPEGIKGAQAAAAAIYLARTGSGKKEIKEYIEKQFGYNLSESVDSIRRYYSFDESCQGTVPQAIICFLESDNFEDAIRKAISVGGDSDTLACITGGIAESFYGVPESIKFQVLNRLPGNMKSVISEFYSKIK